MAEAQPGVCRGEGAGGSSAQSVCSDMVTAGNMLSAELVAVVLGYACG